MESRAILSLIVFLAIAIPFSSPLFFIDPKWDTSRVTFGKFSKMPLTRKDAESKNFKQIGGKDASCKGKFFGYRYMQNDDPSVTMLYDVKGHLAGVQTSFPQNAIAKQEALNWFKQTSMFTAEELTLSNNSQSKFYTLTAYVVDPKIICSTGRTAQQFEDSKGGTDLYIKNGTSIIAIPKQERDLKNTPWTKGKCIVEMGVHYYYNIREDMDCDLFQPIFIMYNSRKLTGFGWHVYGSFPSPRLEVIPDIKYAEYFNVIPDCLFTSFDRMGGFRTLHIYMSVDYLGCY